MSEYGWVTTEPVDATAIGANAVLFTRVLRPGAIVTNVTEKGEFTVNGRPVSLPEDELAELIAPADWVLVGVPDWSLGRTFRFHAGEAVPVPVSR